MRKQPPIDHDKQIEEEEREGLPESEYVIEIVLIEITNFSNDDFIDY